MIVPGYKYLKMARELVEIGNSSQCNKLSHELKKVLCTLSGNDKVPVLRMMYRLGLTDFIRNKESFFDELQKEDNLVLLTEVCSQYIKTSNWLECKKKSAHCLNKIVSNCENELGDRKDEIYIALEHLVPLLCFVVFLPITNVERVTLSGLEQIQDKVDSFESSIKIIEDRLEELSKHCVNGDLVRYDVSCIKGRVFLSALHFLISDNIKKILCKVIQTKVSTNYFKEVDLYLKKNSTENILQDVFNAAMELRDDGGRSVNQMASQLESLFYLILVMKSGYLEVAREKQLQAREAAKNYFECDYFDDEYRDLDAMMSPLLDKEYKPETISRYYYELDGIESGFTSDGAEQDVCMLAYNVFKTSSSFPFIDSSSSFDCMKLLQQEFADARTRADSPAYVLIINDDLHVSASKKLAAFFVDVAFVNKTKNDTALRIMSINDFKMLEFKLKVFTGGDGSAR